jgi:hypothetical protein
LQHVSLGLRSLIASDWGDRYFFGTDFFHAPLPLAGKPLGSGIELLPERRFIGTRVHSTL